MGEFHYPYPITHSQPLPAGRAGRDLCCWVPDRGPWEPSVQVPDAAVGVGGAQGAQLTKRRERSTKEQLRVLSRLPEGPQGNPSCPELHVVRDNTEHLPRRAPRAGGSRAPAQTRTGAGAARPCSLVDSVTARTRRDGVGEQAPPSDGTFMLSV